MAPPIFTPQDILSHFRREVPLSVQMLLLEIARTAVQLAHEEAYSRFSLPVARDHVISLRRAHFQERFSALALPGARVDTRSTKGATSYAKLEVGSVTITANTRSHRVVSMDPARYRDSLIRSAQGHLFEKWATDAGERLYGILLFGGPRRRSELSVAEIVFPVGKRQLSSARVDLLLEERREQERLEAQNAASQRPANVFDLQLKPRKKKGEEGSEG